MGFCQFGPQKSSGNNRVVGLTGFQIRECVGFCQFGPQKSSGNNRVVGLTGFSNKRMCGLLPVWATKK